MRRAAGAFRSVHTMALLGHAGGDTTYGAPWQTTATEVCGPSLGGWEGARARLGSVVLSGGAGQRAFERGIPRSNMGQEGPQDAHGQRSTRVLTTWVVSRMFSHRASLARALWLKLPRIAFSRSLHAGPRHRVLAAQRLARRALGGDGHRRHRGQVWDSCRTGRIMST